MTVKNRRVVLRSRPERAPAVDNFEIRESPVPPVNDGDVLRRTIYLSLDPYMRGRMGSATSYAPSVELGQLMVGGTVSEVIESRNPAFAAGAFVVGYDGWQEYHVSQGRELRKLDPAAAPISTALGVLGMPGMTAYVGLLDFGRPQQGETVVVSAASGAVGAVAGQIAKLKGCRVVGIAGAKTKCDYVVDELGFDACVSHYSTTLHDDLAAACPKGIDVYFENVGGPVFDAVFSLMNVQGRIPLCGRISEYNDSSIEAAPSLRVLLNKRITVRGFIISDHGDRQASFLRECAQWVREGRLKYREDVVEGLERAPEALLRLFEGRNFGKLLVRVSPDPTQATRG
jgi:NADPH-dependent curcumin reductase CurA